MDRLDGRRVLRPTSVVGLVSHDILIPYRTHTHTSTTVSQWNRPAVFAAMVWTKLVRSRSLLIAFYLLLIV